MEELNITGLHQFISLFLTLSCVTDLEDVVRPAQPRSQGPLSSSLEEGRERPWEQGWGEHTPVACLLAGVFLACKQALFRDLALTWFSRSRARPQKRACLQTRKTRASKSRLVLVLLLTSWESGAFFNQSQSVVNQNQSKRESLSIHLCRINCF